MCDRRRGVFHRDRADGLSGRTHAIPWSPELWHGCERSGHRKGAHWVVSRFDRTGRLCRAAEALLRKAGFALLHLSKYSRPVCVCPTGCHTRSTVLASRSDQLPQPAHLSCTGRAAARDADLSLCTAPAWISDARTFGECGSLIRIFRAAGQEQSDLHPKGYGSGCGAILRARRNASAGAWPHERLERGTPCYLILFEDESRHVSIRLARQLQSTALSDSEKDQRVAQLERENADLREFLQATMEQHEAARRAQVRQRRSPHWRVPEADWGWD